MSMFSTFNKEDYLMIKWQIGFAAFGVILAAVIFWGLGYLNDKSLLETRIAQSGYDAARSRVEMIEEEEATIIEYIGRYKDLSEAGVVDDEDRLEMLERVADVRADNNLFPVTYNISEQTSLRLRYPPDVTEPGEPIDLRSTVITLELPLLHEEDLTRLLDGMVSPPGLYQVEDCEIASLNTNTTNFIVLGQHFKASCDILWYTFDLDPPQEQGQFGY